MEITNINDVHNKEISIKDSISKVLNEMIASDFIKEDNIIAKYHNDSPDEANTYHYAILLPKPYGEELDPNIPVHDNIWHTMLDLLMDTTEVVYLFKSHRHFIYTKTESLLLSYNDETIDIIYHFNGQW